MLWPRSIGTRLRPDLPDVRADVQAWCADEGIPCPSDALVADFYLPMTAWVAEHAEDRMLVLGLNGAQGTGKSTLVCWLNALCFQSNAWGLSLDGSWRCCCLMFKNSRES